MATQRDILTIGVTGHRPERLGLDRLPAIDATVAAVLDAVATAARGVAGDVELRVVSALAEGADCMTADLALARGWTLDSVLPFGRDDYAADFTRAPALSAYRARLEASRAVFELPGTRAVDSDPHAYERAGRVVLAQCDILLAIWDRGPLQGRGGTGQIVAEAVIDDVPVILIDPAGAGPPCLLWDGLEEHDLGQQTLETVPRSGLEDALPRVARALIGRPAGGANPAMTQYESNAPLPRRSLALAFPLLLAVMGVRRLRWSDTRLTDQTAARTPVLRAAQAIEPMADAFAARLRDDLAPRFAKADVLAAHIGQLFRSGYVINFALAALAVALSLAGLAVPQAKPFLIVLELSAIATILILTRTAHRVAWHQRWLDCRHLAERLRGLALSAQLGDLGLRIGADSEPHWVTHAVRATARNLGLPSARVDDAYLAAVRAALTDLIDDQLTYLTADAHRMHRLEHRMHLIGTALFATTALICIGFLGFEAVFKLGGGDLEGLSHRIAIAVTMASGALPAVGAAIYGIRMQGDFAGIAERSETLAHHLAALKAVAAQDELSFDTLDRRIRRAVDLLTADLALWRQTYHARPLSLPG